MYKFNEEFNFELSTKEDIMKMVDILETNKPKITIANFTISLNPFIMLDFKGLTNCDYFDTLYRLFKEAKDFNNLILIAEKICGEQVEEYTNETLSGVLNYLMSELSEKLAANKCYNGNLIDLLLCNS